jgi:glycosyltransferase involved in cell wall biosynthesis
MLHTSISRLPVSVCMISGADGDRIGRALASVSGWTTEIIVVLNQEVSDGTEEIARQHGAKVFREPWKGHIAQKNSAAEKATQPWILGLDTDEELSGELQAEIKALFAKACIEKRSAYSFPRCTFHCGRWIRHGDWYPDRQTRLWKKGLAHWAGVDPHDRLEVKGGVGRLKADLLHYSFKNIDHQISKIGPYSSDFVRQRLKDGRGASAVDLAFRPFWRFIRGYFLKLGFLDGWPGFYIAGANSFTALTRYAKVKEAMLQKNEPHHRE